MKCLVCNHDLYLDRWRGFDECGAIHEFVCDHCGWEDGDPVPGQEDFDPNVYPDIDIQYTDFSDGETHDSR